MRDHVLTLNGQGAGAKPRRKESLEFHLLYGVTFAVFLLAALVEAIIPFRSRERGQKSESIIQKARFGAQTCVKYAFMG